MALKPRLVSQKFSMKKGHTNVSRIEKGWQSAKRLSNSLVSYHFVDILACRTCSSHVPNKAAPTICTLCYVHGDWVNEFESHHKGQREMQCPGHSIQLLS